MTPYVPAGSVVRKIWGKSDTILFIFAGAAAEFALNKAVDWLYFTGRIPKDPIGRLFSTVEYARRIVFASQEDAEATLDQINAIHGGVEAARGARIPDWAYRDVLFMLIHYSIASFELLERKLTVVEKEEVYAVFLRIGQRMKLSSLPASYLEWLPVRDSHMQADLSRSAYTDDLFLQYRNHLGRFRYFVLREAQKLVVPKRVATLLHFTKISLLFAIVPAYKVSKKLKADAIIKRILLPAAYKKQIEALDLLPS